uniref:Uncharacterized protein n=1 Tax=Arundo donax TaxID=35708 RepID=A0A0A9C3H7_ARUDO
MLQQDRRYPETFPFFLDPSTRYCEANLAQFRRRSNCV